MSRTSSIAALLLAALAVLTVGCTGPDVGQRWPDANRHFMASVKGGVDIGGIWHTEESNLVDMESEWESTVFRPRLTADLRMRLGVELSGEVNYFLTLEDEEDWDFNGVPFSQNDMDMQGLEWRALAGYGIDVQHFGRISLFGGLAGRSIELNRELSGGGSSKTEADMYLWEVELRLVLPLNQEIVGVPMTFESSVAYGRLINPEADVEGAGAIEGDFGWVLRVRLGMDLAVTDRLSVYAGGFYEDLKIHGGVEGPYEWTDSDTRAGGGEISVRYRF
ncbi:MAG: hypothetical protein ACYTGB_00500 [Planctomycetota bacterium]|jgi:hypothetical protein